MNKKFIKWQIKQWLPMLAIFTIFLFAFFVTICLRSPIAAYTSSDAHGARYISSYPSSNLWAIYIPSILLTFIMPCFVYFYRYKKQSADFFRQAPVKEGSIRRTKVLIGLGIILVSMTVVFFSGMFLLLARQASYIASWDMSPNNDVPWFLNYGYYVLSWVYLVIAISAQYFINCWLMGRAGTLLDGIILMFLAQIVLAGFLEFPLFIAVELEECFALPGTSIQNSFLVLSVESFPNLCVAEPMIFGLMFFDPLIVKGELAYGVSWEVTQKVLDYLFIVLYMAIGFLTGLSIFKEKDPSGEHFGKAGPRDYLAKLPVYLAGITTGFLVPVLIGVLSGFAIIFLICVFFVFWALGYYVVLAIYNRSFKIGKEDLTYFLATVGGSFVLMALMFFLRVGYL